MLYIATVHYRSPRWIEIQTRYLREHISVPYQTWTSLEGIDRSYAVHFDRVLEQRGPHAGKLNHLALEISQLASDEDLLMFLDGDAFPIADPMVLISDGLARAPLIAVRRAENVEEPQPHPCFCVTTVGTWRSLGGDWTAGPTWVGAHGKPTTDVGGNLLRRLELAEMPWVEVLRSNRRDLDPLHFAIYGDTVYHHGAGFRAGELSPVHRDRAPKPLPVPRLRVLRPLRHLINRQRWRTWERRTRSQQARQSQGFFERIQRGDREWLDELLKPPAGGP
ncbi:MAG: hypothetical protein ABSG95_01200 [Solirubrobacteraceae bacterium]|jgi:hypothetical protein